MRVWTLWIAMVSVGAAAAGTAAEWRAEATRLKNAGDATGAYAALEKVEKLGRPSASLQDEMGFLLAVLNRRSEAMARFRHAVELDPGLASAWYHLGVAAWLDQDPNVAIPALEKAAALRPKEFDYQQKLGEALINVNHAQDAVGPLQAATALRPRDASAWAQLGLAWQQSRHLPEAVTAFKEAVTAFKEAVRLAPQQDDYRNSYALALISIREADRGIAELETILGHKPGDLATQVNIAFAHLQKPDVEKAIPILERVIAQDPKFAAAWYNLGLAYKQRDDLARAISSLDKALELDDRMPEAHYTLGITYWQQGDFEKTAEHMRRAGELKPDYAEAFYMLGTALRQNNQPEEAEKALRHSIELDAGNPGPWNTLAQVLRAKGDAAGAKAAFDKAAGIKRQKEAEQAQLLRGKASSSVNTELH